MIKKILYIASVIAVLLVASCASDSDPILVINNEVKGDSFFTLSLQTDGTVVTRATTEPGKDPMNENVIEKVDLFFYEGETFLWQVPQNSFTMTDGVNADQKKLVIRVIKDVADNLYGKNVTLVAVANGPQSALMANKPLAQLKQMVVESNTFNVSHPQSLFLMEGSKATGTIILDENESYNLGALSLKRVAAKFRLKLNVPTVPGFMSGPPSVRLINYFDKSNLLPTTEVVNALPKSTGYEALQSVTVGGATFFTTPTPYYSYENNWSTDGARETYMLLKIPFTQGGITNTYYYRIPINYRLGDEGSMVQRNHLYEITVNISELGATTAEVPFEVASHVEMKPWQDIDIIQAELEDPKFLVVKQTNVAMADISETKIGYVTSSPASVVAGSLKAEFISYNISGGTVIGNPTINPVVSFVDEGNKKYIKVVSPVPVNFVPLHIEFIVRNADGITEFIEITQYPRRYVTARTSTGNPYRGSESGGSGQNNYNLYRITTVIGDTPVPGAPVGSIIGDPVDPTDNEGKTMNTDEANNIISPDFIIASKYGVTQPRKFNVDDPGFLGWGRAESGVTRCSKYYEDVYGPGRAKGGRWRLPTRAELQYIQQLQTNPNSAVKSLLEGDRYWSGRSYYNFNFDNGVWNPNGNASTTAYIRCVYDIYKYE